LADDTTEPVALQLLSRIDDAGDRAWAADWVAALLARESVAVTPELKEHLWFALTSLASAPVAERTITGLSVLLQSHALKQALQPYRLNGPWGRLLDAEIRAIAGFVAVIAVASSTSAAAECSIGPAFPATSSPSWCSAACATA
jgi:type IV secretory pathway VirB4 component